MNDLAGELLREKRKSELFCKGKEEESKNSPRHVRKSYMVSSRKVKATAQLWQAGGKAKFIYLPPGLTLALAKSLLIDLDLLTGEAEDDRAQAAFEWAA